MSAAVRTGFCLLRLGCEHWVVAFGAFYYVGFGHFGLASERLFHAQVDNSLGSWD